MLSTSRSFSLKIGIHSVSTITETNTVITVALRIISHHWIIEGCDTLSQGELTHGEGTTPLSPSRAIKRYSFGHLELEIEEELLQPGLVQYLEDH